MSKIAIVGNGISGITAARFTRKLSSHQIFVISDESDYFFSRTALMYVYMGHMRWKDIEPYEKDFWAKNKIELIQNRVQHIDFQSKMIHFQDGASLDYDKLILATGSRPNRPDWPGQNLKGVSSLYSKQDLDHIESLSREIKHAVIVGGGLIGIELAEMFHTRHIPVTLFIREADYWSNVLPAEEAKMISDHIRQHQITLKTETQLKEIIDDGIGNVAGVVTSNGEMIHCNFVGITVGVIPNIEFLKTSSLETNKGILVNEFLETSIPDVFAIGDCAELRNPSPGRKSIEAVWYTGRLMGETVANSICNRKTFYNPGIWFNSAKFFDIEYQVYGYVPAQSDNSLTQFFWKHEKKNKSIRIVFDQQNQCIKGFNLMGIRFRQEVCNKWINNKTSADEVIANIRLAFFDPEFYQDLAPYILDAYNRRFNKSVSLRASGSLNSVLQFFKQQK